MSDESTPKLRARALGLAVTTTLLAAAADACTNNSEPSQAASLQSSGSESADAGASEPTPAVETADASGASGAVESASGPEDAATPRAWQNPHGRG